MKCDKCAYCCVHYDVIVTVDPDKGVVEGNLTHKPSGKRCHHNMPDGTCAIHDKPWYNELSCYHYDYGDEVQCPFTPGAAIACRLVETAKVHDPHHVQSGFAQDMLMLINDELVEKNKAAKNRLDKKKNDSGTLLYDPNDK